MIGTEMIQLFSLGLFMNSLIKIKDKKNKKRTLKEFIKLEIYYCFKIQTI
jgi:hypothetical protein